MRRLVTIESVALGAILLGLAMILTAQKAPAEDRPANSAPLKPAEELRVYRNWMQQVNLAEPVTYKGLTVYPLVAAGKDKFYLTMDEGLEEKTLRIEDTGRVPEVSVSNTGKQPVLMVDGEEIVGAKQNRILNSSLLVPPGKTIIAAVTCVEQGRWDSVAGTFKSGGTQLYAAARAANADAVTESLSREGRAVGDQAGVWSSVRMRNESLDVQSSAMNKAFEQHAEEIAGYTSHFAPSDRQVGAVFVVRGKVLGMDLFDSSETLRALYPKLIRSYAFEDLQPQPAAPAGAAQAAAEVRTFLETARTATGVVHPSAGEGSDLRLNAWKMHGSALIARGRPLHIAIFPGAENSDQQDTPGIAPPGVRRR